MKDQKLPVGISKIESPVTGAISYLARIHHGNKESSKRRPTIAEAVAWRTRALALIESGIDPKTVARSNRVMPPEMVPATPTVVAPISQPLETLDLAPVAQIDMSVAQAIDGYLAYRHNHHNKLKPNQITEFQRVKVDLGNMKVINLVNSDIADYISLLLQKPRKRDVPSVTKPNISAKPSEPQGAKALANARYKAKIKAQSPIRKPKLLAEATVRKYVLAMKTAILWQAKNNGVEYHKFLFDFDRNTLPAAWNGQRDRRLLSGEEEMLYSAGIDRGGYTYTQQDWRMLIGFALETALRQQELAFARWEDLRSDMGKLFIPKKHSKTKKDRYILLSGRAREIVNLQRSTCPTGVNRIFHQFPNPKTICDAYKKLTTRAGIDNLTFHDLRHEATSRLCESGKLSLMEIMEMTGHDTMVTFKKYVKLIAHENSRRLD